MESDAASFSGDAAFEASVVADDVGGSGVLLGRGREEVWTAEEGWLVEKFVWMFRDFGWGGLSW